jgi:signal transduction histidine kinase
LVVAAFFSAFLIFSHVFLRLYVLTPNDYLRALMFIVIAFVLVILSERIAKTEDELRKARAGLERRVEERTAELVKVNDELENYVRVVSHDLKNPITHIQGFSSRLFEKHQENLDDEGRICLERINANASRMEVLVSDLLSLSRIGQVVSTFEEVPSVEIIKNVTSGLQDRIQENRIELVTADNLPSIYCDRKRIYQVFENLLANAVKFTVGAKSPKIEIGYKDGEDFHQFYIRDNGIGIDPKHHQKIFEKFERLKEIEDEVGTGLGLAIVDRIVNNHGGRVWVESQRRKGATFYFTLPKAS